MSCESQPLPQNQDKDNTSSDKTSVFQELQQQSLGVQPQMQKEPIEPEYEASELQRVINHGSDNQFQEILHLIAHKIGSDCSILAKNKVLHYRLVKLFYKVFKGVDFEKESQGYAVFLLSLLAEIIRINPAVKIPFTKKIVLSILSININTLESIKQGHKIMKILSILMGNMAQQSKLMLKLGVVQILWESLNLLFSKTEDLFVLRILLKAFLQLTSSANMTLNSQSAEIISITSKVREILGFEAAIKLKLRLIHSKSNVSSAMTLWDMVSNKK